jgi:hypothetical protein
VVLFSTGALKGIAFSDERVAIVSVRSGMLDEWTCADSSFSGTWNDARPAYSLSEQRPIIR